MEVFYQNELTTLYNNDCLKVMDYLIEQGIKVDAIITDPPYLHTKGGMKSKRINTGSYKHDSYVNTRMRDFNESKIYTFLDKAKKMFENSFNAYFFCSKLQLVSYLKWSQENKLNYDLLVWDRLKRSMISTKFYTSNIDYIVRIYGKNRALNKIINILGKGDINYYKKIQEYKQPKNYNHETIKPIGLIEKYILLSTNQNDLILDPFIGSGTTLVAADTLGRRSIGIELEKNYCDITVKRLRNMQLKMDI